MSASPGAGFDRPDRSLGELAASLEATVHETGWGERPLLIGLVEDGSAQRELPPVPDHTDDPVADLLGYDLPQDCSGLAVVAEGNGRRLRGVDDRPDVDGALGRHRLAYVLERSGRAGVALRSAGGVTVDAFDCSLAGPCGRLVDVCHRAIGLRTAPAPADTAQLWLISWLDLLLARSLGRDRPQGWREISRLHPAIALLERVDGALPNDAVVQPDELARLGRALGRAQTWAELRRATAAGDWSPHGITADQARWMDDGMYARWVLGEFLPVEIYDAELGDVLEPDEIEHVRVVERGCPGRVDVPGRPGPDTTDTTS